MLDIVNEEKIKEFLDYKINNNFSDKAEIEAISSFFNSDDFFNMSKNLFNCDFSFSIPTKHLINKHNSNKKRVIYTYADNEMCMLKYLLFLMRDYDYLFSDNLYSFRKDIFIKKAIYKIRRIDLSKMYAYKVDITNYFNSIDCDILLSNLKKDIDIDLYNFFYKLLKDDRAIYNDEIIHEPKGVMAGEPLSAFFSNYYIKEIDEYFSKNKISYFRYADDIIIFSNTLEELNKNIVILKDYLKKYKLEINIEKEKIINPNENIDFLGFEFINDSINITDHQVRKLKVKIKRTRNGIRRWVLEKNIDPKFGVRAMIKKYNFKLLGKDNSELSWKYWYFPIINRVDKLHEIDLYMQESLRYIYSGCYKKKNLKKVPYSLLKDLGYKSLVREYYLFLDMINKV